jgi:hypothetical protein
MKDELDNCKHCGAPAAEFTEGSYWRYIACTKCGIRTHIHSPDGEDRKHHFIVWNRSPKKAQLDLF